MAELISELYPTAELTGLERQFSVYLDQLRTPARAPGSSAKPEPVIVSACPRIHRHVGRSFPDKLPRLSTNLAPAAMALDDLARARHPAAFEVIFVSPCRAKALALKQHVRLKLQAEYPGIRLKILPAAFLAIRLRALLMHRNRANSATGSVAKGERLALPPDVQACHGRRAISRILHGMTQIPPEKSIILPYWCAGGCSGRPAIFGEASD